MRSGEAMARRSQSRIVIPGWVALLALLLAGCAGAPVARDTVRRFSDTPRPSFENPGFAGGFNTPLGAAAGRYVGRW